MYRIIKVLNNNGILVLDGDTGRELILLGNGIGFGHRTGERLEQVKEAKRYELVTGKSTALQQVNSIDPVFIEAAGNIIESARKTLGDISSDILIPMADHIALAAGRAREGRELPNPFNQDIKALFDREYQAAMEGREIIREMTGIVISEDEVGYITLHIHAGSSEENVAHSMDMARLVQDSIRSIEEKMGIKLAADSLGYNRLVSHLRYMIARIRKGEPVSLDMQGMPFRGLTRRQWMCAGIWKSGWGCLWPLRRQAFSPSISRGLSRENRKDRGLPQKRQVPGQFIYQLFGAADADAEVLEAVAVSLGGF